VAQMLIKIISVKSYNCLRLIRKSGTWENLLVNNP
jgi:hypothetical protein